MTFISKYKSKIGNITIASDGINLTGLWFDGQKYFLANVEKEIEEKNLKIFDETKLWLDKYFLGEKVNPNELKLKPKGTDFRKTIWKILCEIPYGQITTYSKIGKLLVQRENKKNYSAQAIGNAIGHNPISIIIPCHRVIGANGNLTGYAGGLEKKKKLLEIERMEI